MCAQLEASQIQEEGPHNLTASSGEGKGEEMGERDWLPTVM